MCLIQKGVKFLFNIYMYDILRNDIILDVLDSIKCFIKINFILFPAFLYAATRKFSF